jgi:hypothetical protein
MIEITGATKTAAQAAPVASAASRHARFLVFHFCTDATGCFSVGVVVAKEVSFAIFMAKDSAESTAPGKQQHEQLQQV